MHCQGQLSLLGIGDTGAILRRLGLLRRRIHKSLRNGSANMDVLVARRFVRGLHLQCCCRLTQTFGSMALGHHVYGLRHRR